MRSRDASTWSSASDTASAPASSAVPRSGTSRRGSTGPPSSSSTAATVPSSPHPRDRVRRRADHLGQAVGAPSPAPSQVSRSSTQTSIIGGWRPTLQKVSASASSRACRWAARSSVPGTSGTRSRAAQGEQPRGRRAAAAAGPPPRAAAAGGRRRRRQRARVAQPAATAPEQGEGGAHARDPIGFAVMSQARPVSFCSGWLPSRSPSAPRPWQRRTGPSYPMRGARCSAARTDRLPPAALADHRRDAAGEDPRLAPGSAARSSGGAIRPTSPGRRWRSRARARSCVAALPAQPPAGKLEYCVHLRRRGEPVGRRCPPARAPWRASRARCRRASWSPHIAAMFFGMLFSNAAALSALAARDQARRSGAGWRSSCSDRRPRCSGRWCRSTPSTPTGPAGRSASDLTDNKTAVGARLGLALWRCRGPGERWRAARSSPPRWSPWSSSRSRTACSVRSSSGNERLPRGAAWRARGARVGGVARSGPGTRRGHGAGARLRAQPSRPLAAQRRPRPSLPAAARARQRGRRRRRGDSAPGSTDLAEATPCLVASGVSCGVCARCLAGLDHLCPRYGLLGEHRDGGYAELVTVPRRNILPIPPRPLLRRGGGDPAGLPDRLAHAHRARRIEGPRGHPAARRRFGRDLGRHPDRAPARRAPDPGHRRQRSRSSPAPASSAPPTASSTTRATSSARRARRPRARASTSSSTTSAARPSNAASSCLKRGGRIVLCGATAGARRRDQPARALLQAALGARLDDGQPRRARAPPALLRVGRPAAGRRPHLPARRGAGGAGVPRPARRLRQARAHRRHGRQGRTASAPCAGGPTVTSHEFVAGLVAEMQTVFARLGAREALEAESRGQVEIVPLLKAGAPERGRSRRARRLLPADDARARRQECSSRSSAATR